MRFVRALLPVLAGLSAPARAAPEDCTPMARLVQQAETDFPSLKYKRLNVGGCAMKGNEFTCGWRFPGDGYGYAEEQTAKLVGCMRKQADWKFLGRKKHESVFALEPDLTMYIKQPDLDSDGWTVWLRIVSTATSTTVSSRP